MAKQTPAKKAAAKKTAPKKVQKSSTPAPKDPQVSGPIVPEGLSIPQSRAFVKENFEKHRSEFTTAAQNLNPGMLLDDAQIFESVCSAIENGSTI